MALAGFSNGPFTCFTDPALTTVDQFSLTVGRRTAQLFFEHLKADDRKPVPQKIVLKPELIVRKSSLRKEPSAAGHI